MLFAKQIPELLSQGYIHYVKVDIQTNKPPTSVYDSRVASRYRTDHRLVYLDEIT